MSTLDKWLQTAADQVFRAAGTAARDELANDHHGGGLVALVRQAQQMTDQIIRQVMERGPASHRPACQAGCAACCHLHVVATPPEVIAIARHVQDQWGHQRLTDLQHKIHHHIQQTSHIDAVARRQLRAPCPFLTAGHCDIHPVRPISCRGWNSLDRQVCDSDLANPTHGTSTPVNLPQYVLAGRIAEGLSAASHALGLESPQLDFVRGMQIALQNPEGVASAWRAAAPVFAEAENDQVFPPPPDPDEKQARQRLWESLSFQFNNKSNARQ